MRISELCVRTGYSPDTRRFYEKMGLLPVARAGRGFKHYTEWHVVRLLQIKYAKAAGFTLAQLRDLLDQWVSGRLDATEKQVILAEQVQKIDQAITELHVVRQYLQAKAGAETMGQPLAFAPGSAPTPPGKRARGNPVRVAFFTYCKRSSFEKC